MASHRSFRQRRLSELITVAAGAILLTACGGSAGTSQGSSATYSKPVTNISCNGCGRGVNLNVWYGKATGATAAGQAALQQYWSKRFQSLTGATVTWTPWFSATDEVNKLNGAVTTHNGPDVFEMGDTFVPNAANAGALWHLTPSEWNLVGGRQRFFPTQMALSGPQKDSWSSVPEFMNPYGMTYNTKLFQQAGIKTPPGTWSEFIKDAQAITALGDGVEGTSLFPSDSFLSWKILYLLTEQMGGAWVSPDLKRATLNTKDLEAAEDFWYEWLTQYHVVPPASLTWTSAVEISNFAKGKIGMMVITTANVEATLKDSSVANDYKFAPLPEGPVPGAPSGSHNTVAATIAVGDNWSAMSFSKHRDLSLRFLNMVTDTKSDIMQQKLTGSLPTNVEAANQLAKQNAGVAVFVSAEKKAVPTPFVSYWGTVEAELSSVQTQIASSIAQGQPWKNRVAPLLGQANSAVASANG